MTSEFSKLYGLLRSLCILLCVFTLPCSWSKLQLVMLSYHLDYGCSVEPGGSIFVLRARRVRCSPCASFCSLCHITYTMNPTFAPTQVESQAPLCQAHYQCHKTCLLITSHSKGLGGLGEAGLP